MTKIISANANIPRGKLLEYHMEFDRLKTTGVGMLLRKDIQKFYDDNLGRIQAIYDLQQKTIKEFYECGEDGQVILRDVIDGGVVQLDEAGAPRKEGVLKEGKTELEFNEVMNKQAQELIPFTRP